MEKKLTNSDPLREAADKHSISTSDTQTIGSYSATAQKPMPNA